MEDLDAETANLEFDVNAIFFYDPKSEDYRTAYVGFNMDYFPPRTCTTVHEPIHSVQEGHSEEMEEAIIEVSQQKETSWEDISYLASVARKMEDLAYITTYLIDPTAVFKGYVKEDAEDCEDNAFAYYSQEEWVELAKQYECLEVYSAGYETSDQGITKVLEHFYDTGVELYELNCEQE